MKKIIYIIMVVIVAGTTSLFYWMDNKKEPQGYLPNTNQSASSFKTYRNEEFGFEFQYPKDLTVRENTFRSYYSKFNLEIFLSTKNGLDSVFLLNIVIPKFVETDFWKSQEKISRIVVGGVEGKKYEYSYEGFPHTTSIMPIGDLKLLLATGDGEKQYLEEYNQILSSFKFLK